MFIDAHQHTARVKGLPRQNGGNFASPEEIIVEMDRTGVDKGILQPLPNPECHGQIVPTEDILEICGRYPDRFIPFCCIDPRAGENRPDYNLSWMMSYYKERGCKGMGEVCASLSLEDPFMLNFFRHCEATQMHCTIHMATRHYGYYGLLDDPQLPRLERVLKQFPKLNIVGHSPVFWAHVSAEVDFSTGDWWYPWDRKVVPGGAIPRLMDACPNLYADISANSGLCALKRDPEFGFRFMEKYQDHLLFGTDICSPENKFTHAEYLRQCLADGNLSRQAFEKISWQNANRIYELGL